MKESLNTISKIIEAEVLLAENKVREYFQRKIEILENENLTIKNKLKDANNIRRIDEQFLNLSDFCRVQKEFLYLDKSGMKQFLFQRGVLKKVNNKYVPHEDKKFVKEHEGELYVSYNYLRSVLAMRSLVMIGNEEDIFKFVRKYTDNKNVIDEQLSNMVVIDYKQTSHEFRNCKGNFYLDNIGGE
ncbi:MAG: hypothetical protein ACRDDY_03770 [Clostridium sp.]|uniref:hypothetical protein n=1 Tax=Clostridium sp. TaxID=1506 RepID=UPI003EE6A7EA